MLVASFRDNLGKSSQGGQTLYDHIMACVKVAHRILSDNQFVPEGYRRQKRDQLLFSVFIHDIGKLDMPSSLFTKRSISEREFEYIRQHPVKGAKLIEPITIWRGVVPYVMYHHEAWDGSGYPFGRAGDSIPFLARVINLAEAFSVMRAPNSYKKQMSLKEAILDIMRLSGKQFDPTVVKVFIGVLEKEMARKQT